MRIDAVIIGAGAAGLAAARELTAHDLSVVILEARDRIGGRIHTIRDAAAPLPIELGAEFIDVPGEAWNALRSAGGAAVRSVDGMWDVRDGIATALSVNAMAERVLGRLDPPPARDVPFRQWLARQDGVSEHAAEWMLRYVEGFHAADLDRVGVHWLSHTLQDSAGGGGQSRHQPLGGFDLAPEGLRRGLRDRVPIRVNTIVTDVVWSRGRVEVRCTSPEGGMLEPIVATRAVVTLPLGVLQAGTVRFDPPIEDTMQAARVVERASVIRIVFRFRDALWEDMLEFRSDDGGEREHRFLMSGEAFPTWWTTSPVVSPLLTAWAGGGAAQRVRELGDPVDVALDSLAAMLGAPRHVVAERVEQSWFHDWDSDPFARCAYSYAPAGGMAALARLREPIADTLFMAGEATAKDGWNGTVDGAIESGCRAARELLAHVPAVRQRS